MNTFCENLRMLRENREMTQREMATILQTNNATYNRYEKGKTEPSIDTLINISDVFGVTVDALVGKEATVQTAGNVSIQSIQLKKEVEKEVERLVHQMSTDFIKTQEKVIIKRITETFNL